MTFYGYEQKRTGEYSITLWEKKGKPGQNVVDVIRAFELVRTSQEEDDFVGGDLQIESVDLGTENFDILTEGRNRQDNTLLCRSNNSIISNFDIVLCR